MPYFIASGIPYFLAEPFCGGLVEPAKFTRERTTDVCRTERTKEIPMSHHDPITREPLAQENRYTRDGIYRQDNSTGGMTIMIVIAALVALGLVYFVASSFWATPTT